MTTHQGLELSSLDSLAQCPILSTPLWKCHRVSFIQEQVALKLEADGEADVSFHKQFSLEIFWAGGLRDLGMPQMILSWQVSIFPTPEPGPGSFF